MVWSASGSFRQFWTDILNATLTTAEFDAANMFRIALYNNSITPDYEASAANSAFNAGQWATANEVSEAVNFPTGGVVLANALAANISGGCRVLDADDVVSGSSFDGTGITGGLIYFDGVAAPVANQGFAGIYFGASFNVVNGTLTIAWPAAGIVTLDTTP